MVAIAAAVAVAPFRSVADDGDDTNLLRIAVEFVVERDVIVAELHQLGTW